MDIRKLMQEMHNAQNGNEEKLLKEKILSQFALLRDTEKEKLKKEFLISWDEQLEYAEKKMDEIDVKLEMMEVSQYINLAKIAQNYFGKSKYWLYQRMSQWKVNGKPAKFTDEERKKLARALRDISKKLENTSSKIA
jgi:uncharacterized UPF0160 family protein